MAVMILEIILSNIDQNCANIDRNGSLQYCVQFLYGVDPVMNAWVCCGDTTYSINASTDVWPKLMAAKATIEVALRDANDSANQPAPAMGA
jgi:hypothetical protein